MRHKSRKKRIIRWTDTHKTVEKTLAAAQKGAAHYERASKGIVNATRTLHNLSAKAENSSGGEHLLKKGFPEVTEKRLCLFSSGADDGFSHGH